MQKPSSVRLEAARAISRVANGESLSAVLPQAQEKFAPKDQPLLAELCYGTLRYYFRLSAWSKLLLEKPLKDKEQDVLNLILVGLYQLFYMRIPAHAAIAETVEATGSLNKKWAKGLVNGVLRSAQRREEELHAMAKKSPVCGFAHPKWMINKLKKAWPDHYESILEGNNLQPPMTLRVNEQLFLRDDYLMKLLGEGIDAKASDYAPQGITLGKATAVDKLPMFEQGAISVQDESAQLSGTLIHAKAGDHILDACCAPGGKTCHLLELNKGITVDALDADENRLVRVEENLKRLNLNARIIHGDATSPNDWWDGKPYDHILLDAPCSATGVIRRHPDIKLLRKADDIDALAALQGQIIRAIWSLLKPGGTLLYATCSIMPQENYLQIEQFLADTADAELQTIPGSWGLDTGFGRQLFPGTGDGFFYSLIAKKS